MELILAILFVILLVFNIVVSNFVSADRMKWHPVVLWGTNDRSYFYTPCIIKVNPKKTTTKKDAKVASAKKNIEYHFNRMWRHFTSKMRRFECLAAHFIVSFFFRIIFCVCRHYTYTLHIFSCLKMQNVYVFLIFYLLHPTECWHFDLSAILWPFLWLVRSFIQSNACWRHRTRYENEMKEKNP